MTQSQEALSVGTTVKYFDPFGTPKEAKILERHPAGPGVFTYTLQVAHVNDGKRSFEHVPRVSLSDDNAPTTFTRLGKDEQIAPSGKWPNQSPQHDQ